MLDIICKTGSDKLQINCGIVTFLNPYSYLRLRYRQELLKEFDVIYIDGEWLCKFLRWFKVANLNRCSFDNTSLAPIVFKNANNQALNISVVGSDDLSIKKFVGYMAKNYPKAKIVYSRNGYFNNETEVEEAIKNIKRLESHILVVGMGAIKQEEFLVKVKASGWKGIGYTCGGFLHQTARSGHEYYPKWMSDLNLRFLYRIWDEPGLLKRYTVDYMKFVFIYIEDVLNFKA